MSVGNITVGSANKTTLRLSAQVSEKVLILHGKLKSNSNKMESKCT